MSKSKKYFHVVLRPDVKKDIKAMAVKKDMTMIDLVEVILTEWLEKEAGEL